MEALAINTPTNNKVVPACEKYSTKMVWFQKYLTNNRLVPEIPNENNKAVLEILHKNGLGH